MPPRRVAKSRMAGSALCTVAIPALRRDRRRTSATANNASNEPARGSIAMQETHAPGFRRLLAACCLLLL